MTYPYLSQNGDFPVRYVKSPNGHIGSWLIFDLSKNIMGLSKNRGSSTVMAIYQL